VLEQPLQDS